MTGDLVERWELVAAWRKPGGRTPKEQMPDTYTVATEAAARIAALEAEVAARQKAGDELRDRLLAFVGAVCEYTNCGPDVDAIKRWETGQ